MSFLYGARILVMDAFGERGWTPILLEKVMREMEGVLQCECCPDSGVATWSRSKLRPIASTQDMAAHQDLPDLERVVHLGQLVRQVPQLPPPVLREIRLDEPLDEGLRWSVHSRLHRTPCQ